MTLFAELGHDLADEGGHDDSSREVLDTTHHAWTRWSHRGDDRPDDRGKHGEGDEDGCLADKIHPGSFDWSARVPIWEAVKL